MTVWSDEEGTHRDLVSMGPGEGTWTFPAGDAGELVETDDKAHVRKLVYGSRVVVYHPFEPEPVQAGGRARTGARAAGGGTPGGEQFASGWDWLLIAGCWAFALATFGMLLMALGYQW